jgi:hypothetical protein
MQIPKALWSEHRNKPVAACSPVKQSPAGPDRNATIMNKLKVKNGTPAGNENLCRNCNWGQFITGYRESDILAICTNTSPNTVLPFTVMECTSFSDKFRPDWEQMKKLAIDIQPVRISKKTTGFSAHETIHSLRLHDEDEEEDE